jgi:hypothetical protein
MDSSQHIASTDEDRMKVTGVDRVAGRNEESIARTAKPTRLSVNISRDTVEALQEIASDKNISMTEAVRRLIGYGIIVYRANRDGYDVLLRRDGKLEKILLVD